jgi:predicted RNA-binding Zn-ribbon protein involved in translation (DUF1610 family)
MTFRNSSAKSSKVCPACGSSEQVYRSHSRNRLEHFINKTKILSTYRCHNCGLRGIRFRKIKRKIKIKSVFTFILILLFTYYFINYILKSTFQLTFFK